MQSVSITTNVVNSNPAQARCTRYNNITLCDKVVSDLRQVDDFLRVLQFPDVDDDARRGYFLYFDSATPVMSLKAGDFRWYLSFPNI